MELNTNEHASQKTTENVPYETPRIETVSSQELEQIVLNVNAATGVIIP